MRTATILVNLGPKLKKFELFIMEDLLIESKAFWKSMDTRRPGEFVCLAKLSESSIRRISSDMFRPFKKPF